MLVTAMVGMNVFCNTEWLGVVRSLDSAPMRPAKLLVVRNNCIAYPQKPGYKRYLRAYF